MFEQVQSGWPVLAEVCRPGSGPAAHVSLAGREQFPPADGSVAPVRQDDGGAFVFVYERDGLRLEDRYEPFPALGPLAWRRSLHFTNSTDQTLDLVRAQLDFQADISAVAWHQHPFHMVQTRSGQLLCVAKWNEAESVSVNGSGQGDIRAEVSAAWRLAPGQSADIREVDVWLAPNTGDDPTRREARRWYAAHGVDRVVYPDWVYRSIWYEASAGGHIDSRFSDVGGFDAFAHQIPYLSAVGINAIWLNAVQTHKSGANALAGWNHYGPRNQLEIDPVLGGPAGFTRLTATMRQEGMHPIGEIVPHGGHSVQAEALPAWHTRDRDGKLRKNWGGCGMDNASPEWQDVCRQSMRLQADTGGIEGVRIDVAPGQGANWGSPRTNHASYSNMGGCLELMAALRDGIRTPACPVPILLPESGDQPEMFAVPGAATLGYGWAFWMFSQKFKGDLLTHPERINQELRDFFENERGSLPPGALGLRTINNHDTVCHSGRPAFRFGVGLQRALYGVLLSVPGVPMLYQEEELGSFEALRRMNFARRALPQCGGRDVVYPPADFAHPAVFAAVRPDPKQPVLCLVNLSGERVVIDSDLPESFPTPRRLCDAITGATSGVKNKRLRYTLAGYQTVFLTGSPVDLALPEEPMTALAAPAEPFAGPLAYQHGQMRLKIGQPADGWVASDSTNPMCQSFVGPAGKLQLVQTPAGLSVTADLATTPQHPGLVLTVQGAQRWQVSGRTALLDDLVLRRRYPFPAASGYSWQRQQAWGHLPWGGLYQGICPSGRLWQALVEPLHPDRPSLAFADASGRAVAVCDLHTDAMNVVLTDASDETPEPERLELRILGIDADLAVGAQRFGRGQPWQLGGLAPVESRPLHAEFLLRFPESATECSDLLQAIRLPYAPPGADLVVDAPKVSDMGGRQFLPEPGSFTWKNLAAVEGRFGIELELRLSERSGTDTDLADAYEITLDDQVLPVYWGQKDVWHTGNAYFAKGRIGPVDLGGAMHQLRIRTLRPWCAFQPAFHLIPAKE